MKLPGGIQQPIRMEAGRIGSADRATRASHRAPTGLGHPAGIGLRGERPRLLDLFCCAGGAAMGYHQAGFEVVGVDINPQPRYPFEFIQADCLALDPAFVAGFDAIHASPPCQDFSPTRRINATEGKHPRLIEPTREMLRHSGHPYVIENVVGAPLVDPIILCGLMFGRPLYRHRKFECSFFVLEPGHPRHHPRGATKASRGYSTIANGATIICCAGNNFRRVEGAAAMGIDWPTTRSEIAQAIPPAYTRFIGEQLMAHLLRKEAA